MRRARPRTAFTLVSATGLAVAGALATASPASAASIAISADQYTNTTSQHATQVEPDSFAFGNTIVTAAQTGRFNDGGSSNINVAVSTNAGATWTTTGLPGLTNKNTAAPGPYSRVSDPVVAYDAKHNVWLVNTLPLNEGAGGPVAMGIANNRSTDGGLTWGPAAIIPTSELNSVDKNWIVCDNTATSPFYGNCYAEWDANGDGNRIYMSTSSDGGLTWSARAKPANNATGIGGQPLVQPNGTVIVPIDNANETALLAFRSTNGGATWSATTTITGISHHTVAGGLRTGPLPSAEIDAAGKVYVAWQDCRFRRACRNNDIVFTTSTDGVSWTAVQRVPIDATASNVEHFIPGLAVDRTTSGTGARLALAYYFYPDRRCTASTCQLSVGYVSSPNGGSSWSAPQTLAGPMSLSWLPNTTQGRMAGDYISTSFVGGNPVPVFTSATAPTGSVFNQRMFAFTGLTALGVGAAQSEVAIANIPAPQGAAAAANGHARR